MRPTASALLVALATAFASPAIANEPARPRISEVDTEHLFGFTVGSDVEEPGAIVPHVNSLSAFGRRGGLYGVLDQNIEIKYGVRPGLAVSAALNGFAARIRGVPGLPDTYGGGVSGLSLGGRWQVFDRQTYPIGLTLDASGGYDSRDPVTGRGGATVWSGGVRAALDSELIHDRLFAAVNIALDTQSQARSDLPGLERTSGLAFGAALSTRIASQVFLGVEASYRRAYGGSLLGQFQGDAFYLGPSLYVTSGKAWLTVSLAAQLRGHEVGGSPGLNLRDFERYRLLVVFGKPL